MSPSTAGRNRDLAGTRTIRIVIAGGGTGGHLFPMLAVARALEQAAPGAEILFVGTSRGIESRLVPEAGYKLATLWIGGLKRKSIFKRFVTLAQLPVALAHSACLLARFGPHVVLGGGGYASGPVGLAASLQGIPLALLEVNSLPGLTNRKLARRAKAAFLAFEVTAGRLHGCRCLVTGNPVRADIRKAGDSETARNDRFRLFVLGGSQGAVALNSLVLEALPRLREMGLKIDITHQAGARDFERVKSSYRETGWEAVVEPFISDMAAAYAAADIVVCRAGATTVAELIAARRPAILVPLPTAADNHQEHNAMVIVDAGGGELLRQAETDGAVLAERIAYWYHRREQLPAKARSLAALDRPDAAERIAAELISLAGGES
jgi:UDP-N-acetylglucosamine--N-acetylmuramyl-(pentapeptide) pyrophosphoryl-undecaprenol N-acetylglucosamine transferase